jgi:hypothetical protein
LKDTLSESQKERADLLFEKFPKLKKAYCLSIKLSNIFERLRTSFMRENDLAPQVYDLIQQTLKIKRKQKG